MLIEKIRMETQDVIFTQARLVKTIYNPEDAKCLQEDKGCSFLLHALLDKPMTFDDIKKAFAEVGKDGKDSTKSDKTIYGYLNKLKKAGLVMEAGKRVISDPGRPDKRIRDLTLYSRTAKVFYIALETHEDKPVKGDYFTIIAKLTRQLLGAKDIDFDCFGKYYDEFTQQKRKEIEKLNEIDNPIVLDRLSTLDARSAKYIIDTICWLSFIGKKGKVHEELVDCFK
jgi:hypothetical protein